MDESYQVAVSIVAVLIFVFGVLSYLNGERSFKMYLKSQLHPTEREKLDTKVVGVYIGSVMDDHKIYELYTNGKGGFTYKRD